MFPEQDGTPDAGVARVELEGAERRLRQVAALGSDVAGVRATDPVGRIERCWSSPAQRAYSRSVEDLRDVMAMVGWAVAEAESAARRDVVRWSVMLERAERAEALARALTLAPDPSTLELIIGAGARTGGR